MRNVLFVAAGLFCIASFAGCTEQRGTTHVITEQRSPTEQPQQVKEIPVQAEEKVGRSDGGSLSRTEGGAQIEGFNGQSTRIDEKTVAHPGEQRQISGLNGLKVKQDR